MLNRKKAPELQNIGNIDFVKPHVYDITEKCHLFFMNEVPNDTSRIDLHFDAGSGLGELGIASFVGGLLFSGTAEKSSIQISNELDALGAFYESNVAHEQAMITVYALKENIVPILRIIKDAVDNVSFHEDEVQEMLNDRKQKFRVNMGKVSFLAQRKFQEKLLSGTPYGRIVEEDVYDNVSISALKRFHKENYLNGLTKVVLVGDLTQDEVDEIIDITGAWATDRKQEFATEFKNETGTHEVLKSDAIQSAIRVGRILFNKTHPDFIDFQVLNTILGDYFGSRLMSNIREDKGYTYGIGSMVAELHYSGYFLIATEVAKEVKDATIQEVKYELEKLKEELVSAEELELVKNYMLGQLLKSADGPYSMIDLYMGLEPYDMEMEFYNRSIDSIKAITPERIRELVVKYLDWNDMTVVVAGS
jgi:zinc protease